jgi:hypothetical protein
MFFPYAYTHIKDRQKFVQSIVSAFGMVKQQNIKQCQSVWKFCKDINLIVLVFPKIIHYETFLRNTVVHFTVDIHMSHL